MAYVSLNCTNIANNCIYCITESRHLIDFEYIMVLFLAVISVTGVVLNSIANFIFLFSKNMNTKFLNLLKYYSLNCLLFNLNSLICEILYFTQRNIYTTNDGKFFQSYHWIFYITHPYLLISTVLYTFDGVLDIFIVYERIVLMRPKTKFLKHISARVISFSVFIFCCIVNIPINIGREVQINTIVVSNMSFEVFKYDMKNYYYQTIYMISVYFGNALRDLLPLIIGIVLNIYLIIVTIRFHKNRITISASLTNPNETIVFKKTNVNNTKLAFLLAMISFFFDAYSFGALIIYLTLPTKLYWITTVALLILYEVKHSANIFILLKLNMKFRRNFIFLMPKFISKCLENKTATT